MAKPTYQNVRGTKDLLPDDWQVFGYVSNIFSSLTTRAGFKRIETPILEPAEIFTRSIGEATDIVEKEMYIFRDRSDNQLVLKPEGTAQPFGLIFNTA